MKFVQMISFLKYDIIKMKAKCLGLNKFMKFFFIPFSAQGVCISHLSQRNFHTELYILTSTPTRVL